MRYRVLHRTRYVYDQPVELGYSVGHLGPRSTPEQSVFCWELAITPAPAALRQRVDWMGNQVTVFSVEAPHQVLEVESKAEVEVTRRPVDPTAFEPWESTLEALGGRSSQEAIDAAELVVESPCVSAWTWETRAYALESFPPGRSILEGALDLTRRINGDFRYQRGATTVATPVAEVLRYRQGVCQDFAQVQIAMLRSLGLAARYVSGYRRTLPPPGQPRLVGVDESHAWVAVWTTAAGWLDLDPTSGALVGNDHVTVAWGRDYQDVAPIKGVVLGGGRHSLWVSVDVAPLD